MSGRHPDLDPTAGGMEGTIAKNLLKHAAGRAMFCQCCKKVLDWQTVVLIEETGAPLFTMCGDCWEALGLETRDTVRDGAADITYGPKVATRGEG